MKMRNQISVVVALGAMTLSGCGGSASSTDTPQSTSAGVTSTAPVMVQSGTENVAGGKATVQFGVNFPAPEASAAWLGSATTIQISFFASDVATWGDAEQAQALYALCQEADVDADDSSCGTVSESSLKGELIGSIELTAEGSTGYLNLDAGYYRVEAAFIDESGTVLETSVSYSNIPRGAHTIRLKGLSADWQFESPVAPILLGSSAAMALESDWDPATEGIQSPLDVMALTGSSITGFKLPNAASNMPADSELVDDRYGQEAALQAGLMASSMSAESADNTSWFLPVLTTSDASGAAGALNVTYSDHSDINPDATFGGVNAIEYSVFDFSSRPVFLHQSYDGESNSLELDLGGREVSFTRQYLSDATGEVIGVAGTGAELMMGVPAVSGGGSVYEMTNLQSGVDRYWGEDGWTDAPSMAIATIETTVTEDDTWLNVFVALQAEANQVVDGSHISGYLVEHLYRFEASGMAADASDAPQPVSYLGASLSEIAQAEGLVASAAADENCTTYSNGTASQFSNQYRWDVDNQRWIAGTFNSLLKEDGIMAAIDERVAALRAAQAQYAPGGANANTAVYDAYESVIQDHLVTYRDSVLAMADMNQDGVASLFEPGVYIKEGIEPACWLTQETVDGLTYYGMDCYEVTPLPTVSSIAIAQSGTVCTQPFSASASTLSVVTE